MLCRSVANLGGRFHTQVCSMTIAVASKQHLAKIVDQSTSYHLRVFDFEGREHSDASGSVP
jgi:hypothetical protein